jgi:hypothetical protein
MDTNYRDTFKSLLAKPATQYVCDSGLETLKPSSHYLHCGNYISLHVNLTTTSHYNTSNGPNDHGIYGIIVQRLPFVVWYEVKQVDGVRPRLTRFGADGYRGHETKTILTTQGFVSVVRTMKNGKLMTLCEISSNIGPA